MQRRKFLATVGSLTAASAVAIGTGAVSQQQSTRSVNVDVVADNMGLIQFVVDHESLENSEYASISGDGQLELHLDENADLSNDGWAGEGEGLNPNSTFIFDNVFQIRNATKDHLHVSIDKSQLDNPDAITFYGLYTDGNLMGSRESDWNGQVNAGFGVNIGIRIETPDSLEDDWESGSIRIIAKDVSDQNIS